MRTFLRSYPEKPVLIQRKLTVNTPGDRFEREADRVADQVVRGSGPIQRQAAPGQDTGGTLAPPAVHEALSSSGRPLDPSTRGRMEERFGHDFGKVRIHDDARAAESAQQIDALAYTAGTDIVFGSGHYDTATESGQRLLAHELTHVVQQAGGGSPAAGMVQRQPASPGTDLRETAPPTLASALGSTVVDKFPLGSAKIPKDGEDSLRYTARQILFFLQKYPASTVQITGHTDTVDTADFNLKLGQDRADAVKAFLVKEGGVPEGIITTDSQGESSPVVPTKNGVAEPLNRRANVFFRVNKTGLSLGLEYKLEPPKAEEEPAKKPLDLGLGKFQLPEPEEPDLWKKMEDIQKRIESGPQPTAPKSLSEAVSDAVVDAVRPLLKKLPLSEERRKQAEGLIRDGLKKAGEKGCEAAIDALDIGSSEKEALKTACKAAIEQKPGGKP